MPRMLSVALIFSLGALLSAGSLSAQESAGSVGGTRVGSVAFKHHHHRHHHHQHRMHAHTGVAPANAARL